jgi:hypothetical protein
MVTASQQLFTAEGVSMSLHEQTSIPDETFVDCVVTVKGGRGAEKKAIFEAAVEKRDAGMGRGRPSAYLTSAARAFLAAIEQLVASGVVVDTETRRGHSNLGARCTRRDTARPRRSESARRGRVVLDESGGLPALRARRGVLGAEVAVLERVLMNGSCAV